jgi:hypothetical protein
MRMLTETMAGERDLGGCKGITGWGVVRFWA